MEWLGNSGFIGAVLLVTWGSNVLLGAVLKVLFKVKGETKTELDDKAYAAGSKVAPMLQKLVDWLTGNLEHGKDISSNGSKNSSV